MLRCRFIAVVKKQFYLDRISLDHIKMFHLVVSVRNDSRMTKFEGIVLHDVRTSSLSLGYLCNGVRFGR